MTAATDHAARLTPSKLETARMCMARFRFEYVDRLPRRARADAELGNAADTTANEAYLQRKARDTLPAVGDVLDRFAAMWDWHAALVEEWDGETRGAMLDDGVRCMRLWRTRVAPHVRPESVQPTIRRQFGAAGDVWTLSGRLDVVADTGAGRAIADLKLSARRFGADRITRSTQPAAYSLLSDAPIFEFHVLVRTVTPQVQILRGVVDDVDRAHFLRVAEMTRRTIRAASTTGDWIPNRGHFLCSRRYCPFADACEREYGGRVPA